MKTEELMPDESLRRVSGPMRRCEWLERLDCENVDMY